MKRSLAVSIILRFPIAASVQLVALLERSLDAVESAGEVAVNWNYPLHFLFSDSSSRADNVIERLKARTTDLHLPMGYTGAFHPLLAADELKRELRWMEKNGWHEDMQTVFDTRPEAFFPACVDLTREPIRKIYQESPPLLVHDSTRELIHIGDGTEFRGHLAIEASRVEPRSLSKQLARRHRKEPFRTTVVIIDQTTCSPDHTEQLLRAIADLKQARSAFSVVPITELSESEEESPVPIDGQRLTELPNDPISRRLRASLATMPKGRKRGADDLIRRRLERLTVIDVESAKGLLGAEELAKISDRTLVADMSGEITLTEGRLSARFEGGRLNGILDGTSEIVTGAAATARMVRGEQIHEYTTISAFSFDDRNSRGLRVLLGVSGPELSAAGQIVADYFFEEGKEPLSISLRVSHPEFKDDATITEYSLFELPLFLVDRQRPVEVEGQYPDGDRYTLHLTPTPGELLLFGNNFRFTCGDREFVLGFACPTGAPPEVLPVRFRSAGEALLLSINPFGSYLPSPVSAFAGREEQLELTVTARQLREVPEGRSNETKPVVTSG